jgi:predicted DNA-binding transcriptional regulator YafY
MLNINPGAEYSFDYVSQDGEKTSRTIIFTGLIANAAKDKVYLRGYDTSKKEYRTFDVDNVDLVTLKHVRG